MLTYWRLPCNLLHAGSVHWSICESYFWNVEQVNHFTLVDKRQQHWEQQSWPDTEAGSTWDLGTSGVGSKSCNFRCGEVWGPPTVNGQGVVGRTGELSEGGGFKWPGGFLMRLLDGPGWGLVRSSRASIGSHALRSLLLRSHAAVTPRTPGWLYQHSLLFIPG